ncbi:hypothetical protein [Pedobacter jamesrossensis]|uniref:Restriction endonuclease n=1 Tax=Pedobacter jamesrossensis TaxID=1908238 RepID=A0ABV8NHX5_9SPHI
MKKINPVPPQITGSFIDVVEVVTLKSKEQARIFFELVSQRLLSVNEWGRYAGISEFKLLDKKGNKIDRQAAKGDYIRIDVPGPGTKSGRGYDWVKVESIVFQHSGDEQLISLQVRPTHFPLGESAVTAHFLRHEATSTFIVRCLGKQVFAEEHGRNELPNTVEGSIVDRGRNFLVGIAAKLGMSYPQWKRLVKGLLAVD